MRRALVVVVLLASCHTAPVPEGPAEPRPDAAVVVPDPPARVPATPAPTLRLPTTLTAVAYRASLAIDPAKDGFHGELTMDAQLNEAASVIWLHADRLTFTSATAEVGGDTITLEPQPLEENFVGFASPVDLPAGPIVLRFSYDSVYEVHDSMGVFKQPVDGKPYVFTQFEALGARRAFPCIDEPGSKVPWTLSLDLPVGVTAVSNTPIDDELTMTGVHRVTFATTPPLPSYLVAFAVGPFEAVDAGTTPSGAPIRVLAFEGQRAKAKGAAEGSAEVLKVLEDYFGMPYPYAKLDLVPIPTTTWFGAMENAGMITFRADVISHDAWTETDLQGFAWYLGHEAAHQWFGDLVTMGWWDDIWLNEAFATWMEEKVMTQLRPGWVADETWVQHRANALAQDGLVSARMIHQPIAEPSDIQSAFDGITYQKGATVIRMFERWIGADAFRTGIRNYLVDHANGTATSDDFLAAIDAVSDLDVTSAFRTFLDQAGAPRVSAELSCQGSAGTISLRQDRWLPRGAPVPEGAAPTWTFPVCVDYGDGKTRGQACLTMQAASERLPLDACPTWILPNADSAGYYRVGLTHAGITDVLDHGWKQLTEPERLMFAYDVTAMVSRGDATLGDQLDLVSRLVTAKASKEAVQLAAGIAGGAWWIADDKQRPVVAKWIRDTFGKRAAKLGWQTGANDSAETQDLRGALVPLVAGAGADAKLRKRAVALARSWPKLAEADRVRIASAALPGNKALRDKLIASLKSPDQNEVRDAASALGGVQDPAEAEPILAALLDPAVDLSIAVEVLFISGEPKLYKLTSQFLRDHFDELRPRIADQSVASLIYVLTSSCKAEDRAPAEAWATDHIAGDIGAPRTIANALEGLDQCVAQRAALAPELATWLKGRKK